MGLTPPPPPPARSRVHAPGEHRQAQATLLRAYKVTEVINEVAVCLALPPRARLHDVFHVNLLKKFHGDPPTAPPPMSTLHHGAVTPEPEHVIKSRLARGVEQVLVQWKGASAASATWEDREPFATKYPGLQLEDELPLNGGRDVMCGKTYTRRRRAHDVRRATECAAQARQEINEPVKIDTSG